MAEPTDILGWQWRALAVAPNVSPSLRFVVSRFMTEPADSDALLCLADALDEAANVAEMCIQPREAAQLRKLADLPRELAPIRAAEALHVV